MTFSSCSCYSECSLIAYKPTGLRFGLQGEFSRVYFQNLLHKPASRPICLLPRQGSVFMEYFPKNLTLQADAQPSTADAMFEYLDILPCKPNMIDHDFMQICEQGQISFQSLFYVPAGTCSSTRTCQNLIIWMNTWLRHPEKWNKSRNSSQVQKRTSTNFYFSLSPYPRADTTTMSLDSTRDSSYAQIPWPRVEGQGSSNPENRHVQPRR